MSSPQIIEHLTEVVEELSAEESMRGIFHEHRDGDPLPSGRDLEEIISLSRSILFPDTTATPMSTRALSAITSG